MAPEPVEKATQLLTESKFGKEVLGPKVARPLAGWLQRTFSDADAVDPSVDLSTPNSASSFSTSIGDATASAGRDVAGSATGTAAPGGAAPPVSARAGTATAGTATAGTAIAGTASRGAVTADATATQAFTSTAAEAARPPKGIKEVALALKDRIKDHNLIVVAAGIAFWGLLAIPAVLFATISIAGLVLDPATIKEDVKEQLSGAPEEVQEIIGEQLEGVASSGSGGLIVGVVVGILLALWSASGAMAKLMSTLNTIYEVKETRKFVKLRGTALIMTIGGIVMLLVTMFALTALPALLAEIDGVGDTAAWLFSLISYPALGLVMILGLGVLYRWGPDRVAKYRPFLLGAVVATVLWIVFMVAFSVYTSTVATYNETYGSLGGLVVMLLFLLITALVVLIGAEVHALTGRDTREASPSGRA